MLVWQETTRLLDAWFQEWDVSLSSSGTTTVGITESLRDLPLLVIASAGFQLKFERATLGDCKPGHQLSFRDALFTSVHTLFTRILLPSWLPLPAVQRSHLAFTELRKHIMELIAESRAGKLSDGDEAADLLRRLVAANSDGDEEGTVLRLSDDELVSNIFVGVAVCRLPPSLTHLHLRYSFSQETVRPVSVSAAYLFATDTTSGSLHFVFALLAIHPEIQEKLFQETLSVWPDLTADQASISFGFGCISKLTLL